jgi:glycosyltransferase involved in cell wall biosynthesis
MDINSISDYDLAGLRQVTPRNRDFRMFVTRRYLSHYGDNAFEEYTSDLLLKYVKDGSVFIDIGAHYGYYTLLIGSQKPKCRILSFEPVTENVEILKKNVVLNNLMNVEIHQEAVSNTTDTVRLESYLGDIGEQDVTLKIGTQGRELNVLEGMQQFLRDHENVKMVIEFNPKCIAATGYKPDDLLNKIISMDFDIYFILDDKRLFYKLDPAAISKWPELMQGYEGRYLNLLCIKTNKSLNVSFFSPSCYLTGADKSLLELISELMEDYGALVSVISPGEGPLNDELRKLGAAVITARYYWWYDWKTMPDSSDTTFTISIASLINALINAVSRINPDILVTNTLLIPWGALTATMLNKPHAWFVREIGPLESEFTYYLPFKDMLKIVSTTSNVIFTNSNVVKSLLFPESDKVIPAYTHFDMPQQQTQAGGADIFSRVDSTKLMVIGAVVPSKGQTDAVLAVKELVRRGQDVELAIVGAAWKDYADTLNKLIDEANLRGRIKMLWWTDKPYWAMRQADIILVCSRFESFGRVTAEAMMLGKPVIGADNTGTAEIIRNGYNGLLYKTGDHIQLADRIEYLINHKEKIDEFGHNGLGFAKKTFSRENFGGKVYSSLMPLKNAGNPADSAYINLILRLMAIAVKQLSTTHGKPNRRIAELTAALRQDRPNQYYQLFLQGLHIISNEGWKAFWKRFRAYLKHTITR